MIQQNAWTTNKESDFYQMVFAIEHQLSSEQKRWYGIGRDSFPADELIRFKAEQGLGFPGGAVKQTVQRDHPKLDVAAFDIFVSFLGLTGPSGTLPMHYSELVLERIKRKDPTMRDFFDLFNHRLIALFYRAWEKYRFSCQYQSTTDNSDTFSYVLKMLAGQRDELSLFYAGFFARPIRSAQLISSQLSHLLNANVEITPLKGRWIYLNKDEQSQLPNRQQPLGQFAQLGYSCMLGSRVWDINSTILINISAQPNIIRSLLPGKSAYLKMQQLINTYLDPAIQTRVCLTARNADFPGICLQGKSRLGMSGVLTAADSRKHHITHVSFRLTRTYEN